MGSYDVSASGFSQDELKSITERALSLAKGVRDPGMRISLQLLGEAAANVAAKLPAIGAPATPPKERRDGDSLGLARPWTPGE